MIMPDMKMDAILNITEEGSTHGMQKSNTLASE